MTSPINLIWKYLADDPTRIVLNIPFSALFIAYNL